MPNYPKRALSALAYLFRPYNDIDVYVEDTACRNVYEVLINRILAPNASVARIFQLGGRDRVIDKCRQQQGKFTRPCLFIVDADFDLPTGSLIPALERLHRLNAYCCENLLFCPTAATEVAYECLHNMPKPDVERIVNFAKLQEGISTSLHDLFVVYATVWVLDNTIETSGCHVHTLCHQVGGYPVLSRRKVRQKRRALLTQLSAKYSKKHIDKVYQTIIQTISSAALTYRHLVSGKTYLLPLLLTHLCRVAQYRGNKRTLMVQLAKHCDLSFASQLCEAVRSAARKPVFKKAN